MLFTVYDNDCFYNVDAVTLNLEEETYYIDINFYIQGKKETITTRAYTKESYTQLCREINQFIIGFVQSEIKSKTLNKNLYKSWRGEIMKFNDKLKKLNLDIETNLGYCLNMLTNYSKDYINFSNYCTFIKIATTDEITIVKSIELSDDYKHIKLLKTDGSYLIIQIVSQEKSAILLISNMIDSIKGDAVNDKELISINSYLTGIELESILIRENFISIERLKELIQQNSGYIVSIVNSKPIKNQ